MKARIRDTEFDVCDEPKDFWGWVSEGHYDKEWKLIDEYLKPEHTFIDLGAWIGSHSLYASRIARRVIAVEPDPVAYAILRKNINHALCPIETVDCAITKWAGRVVMGSGFLGASTTRMNPATGGGIGAWEEGHSFETYGQTLRRFCEKLNVEDPIFIKMDVEGSEEDILYDTHFFRERKPVLYLEQHPWWWKDKERTLELIEETRKVSTVIG